MALGDGIRRNIALVEPEERALFRDAMIELNRRFFPGNRTDDIPGGVSWWFKQDEIHQGTHVHAGPEFLPWHREIVNRLEAMLRQINGHLSLHYWDWTQDPRNIPNANLGGGTTGILNLFKADFMGYGGSRLAPIGEPWLSAGYYVPGASLHRDATHNPADPPQTVERFVSGSPATVAGDLAILNAGDYAAMRIALENVHNSMHGFVNMGSQHISFRDPFVFLLHSNVDRLLARWQTDPAHPERLNPDTVYGSEKDDPSLNGSVKPWSGGLRIRPWASPEDQGMPHTYKDPSIVSPPRYDTNHSRAHFPNWELLDNNPVSIDIVAEGNELYQLHNSGAIWKYTGTPLTGWEQLDNNPATKQIAAGGNLYQRHETGAIWKYTGTPFTGWELLDNNPETSAIVAEGNELYQLHKTGAIWKYAGTPLTGWELLDNNPATRQIAAGGNFYQRHESGAIWRYNGPPLTGWELLDNNPATVDIIADSNLYQLHNSGAVWKYNGTPLTGWELLDNNPATRQVVADGNLYQRHETGGIWKYTGTPLTGWEQLDNNPSTTKIVAAGGKLYQFHSNGFIWRYTG